MSLKREILDEYLDWFAKIKDVPVTRIICDEAEFKHTEAMRYICEEGAHRPIADGWHSDYDSRYRYYHTQNGYLHSIDDNPSYIRTYGTRTSASWDHMGKCHRSCGPAWISRRGKDAVTTAWSWHGVTLSLDSWLTKSDLPDAEKVQLKMIWG